MIGASGYDGIYEPNDVRSVHCAGSICGPSPPFSCCTFSLSGLRFATNGLLSLSGEGKWIKKTEPTAKFGHGLELARVRTTEWKLTGLVVSCTAVVEVLNAWMSE